MPQEKVVSMCPDFACTCSARLAKARRKRTPKPTGGAFGAPRRRRGRLGLWVLLRFRLALASRALRVRAFFPKPPERKK